LANFWKWLFGEHDESSRQKELELKSNSLLKSITEDCFNKFTHDEQSQILVLLIEKFKAKKADQRSLSMRTTNEITNSLKRLK